MSPRFDFDGYDFPFFGSAMGERDLFPCVERAEDLLGAVTEIHDGCFYQRTVWSGMTDLSNGLKRPTWNPLSVLLPFSDHESLESVFREGFGGEDGATVEDEGGLEHEIVDTREV